jgi:hypothetical protein
MNGRIFIEVPKILEILQSSQGDLCQLGHSNLNIICNTRLSLILVNGMEHMIDLPLALKVETPYHDNNLILTPITSPQSGWQ